MPKFRYTAVDLDGRVSHGIVVVLHEKEIEQRLAAQKLILVRTEPLVESGSVLAIRPSAAVKPRMLIEFYYRLGQALQLGMPLLSALDENARLIPSKAMGNVIDEMRVAIEGGNTVYDAMRRFPKVFSPLDLATIRMGEQSGNLPRCIQELTTFLEWRENLRSIIKRATIYPTFILITITAVTGVWVGYVLPQMAKLLKEMGMKLPTITLIILNSSGFLQENWFILLVLLFLAVSAFILFKRTPAGAFAVDRFVLKLPVIGTISSQIALARLSRSFAIMFSSGLNINAIFGILTDKIIGNSYLEERVRTAHRHIESGHSIADGFESVKAFPPFFIGAVKNGETTGTLDQSFQRLADYYDTEVKRTVQILIEALEPATFIILGGVFGVIILSIMLPLYDLINQLGQAY